MICLFFMAKKWRSASSACRRAGALLNAFFSIPSPFFSLSSHFIGPTQAAVAEEGGSLISLAGP
jgi:hypothetical protein